LPWNFRAGVRSSAASEPSGSWCFRSRRFQYAIGPPFVGPNVKENGPLPTIRASAA
jgi:hypothetical protein